VRLVGPDASDADVQAALRGVRVWTWVARVPDGWDTPPGPRARRDDHAPRPADRERARARRHRRHRRALRAADHPPLRGLDLVEEVVEVSR